MTQIIKVDEEIKNEFNKNNIFFSANGSDARIRVGQKIALQDNIEIEPYCSINTGFNLNSMGSFSYTNAPLPQKNIVIGRYCSLANKLNVQGSNHPINRFSTSNVTYDRNLFVVQKSLIDNPNSSYKTSPNDANNRGGIIIHNDVWIGSSVTLVPGIEIGNGAIIGSNSLVTKNVPAYAIVGGVPAKIIRYRFAPDVIKRLQVLRWWDYAFWDFEDFDVKSDIIKFCDFLESKVKNDSIVKYTPEVLTIRDFYSSTNCIQQLNEGNYFNICPNDIINDFLCDRCRDQAIKIEHQDLNAAHHLMNLALSFRPSGSLIIRKVKEYQDKINCT